jgi:hypothetical protein
MSNLIFTPSWTTEDNPELMGGLYGQEHIKNEPMLFSASYEDAMRLGGPITRTFMMDHLDYLERVCGVSEGENWIIDSRVHMLMDGWWPCIPGFHNDDIPRGGEFGQPYWNGPEIEYKAEHLLMVLGPIGMTEFISPGETFEVSNPIGKEEVYGDWNKEIRAQVESGKVKTQKVISGQVVRFSEPDFHRGMPAEGNGWRFFIRASKGTPRKCSEDPLRRQVQVYMETPEKGW